MADTQTTRVRIDSLAFGGDGVGRLADGRAVFVAGTAPGDVADVEVVEDKGSFARARMAGLEEAGPDRVRPACPWAGVCGGCDWQHVAYPAQLQAKRDGLVSQLSRIGGLGREQAEELVAQPVGAPSAMGYRNKLELAAGADKAGRLVLGLRRPGSHEVVGVGRCPLAQRPADKAPKALQGALRYLQGSSDLRILRVGVRTSLRTHDVEVAAWTRPGAFPRAEAVKTLKSALRATSVTHVIADPGRSRVVRGVEALWGRGCWSEQVAGHRFRVSAPSFFQVNTKQADTLVRLVLEGLGAGPNDLVADLYCGVGTFTLPLAERAGQVLAVEREGSSVRDLRRNVEDAGTDNVEVIGGDSARELAGMGRLDGMVVDPPRAGLAPQMADEVAEAAPRRLAYVSCDGATWARDVARLSERGYRLASATPVDMFPQTYHCEVVSFFDRVAG